jgi:hypothetical protein
MMLSRAEMLEIRANLDYAVQAHMEDHTLHSYRTCPYCQSILSIDDALAAIITAMPTRMAVWIS